MVGPSKILTVSYGTFSCTLEGFDDPFSTMKAIAEYFRDLAAEDRFFGAEPPTPDVAMLTNIAKRSSRHEVKANVGENAVLLRQAEETTAVTADPTPAAKPAPKAPAAARQDSPEIKVTAKDEDGSEIDLTNEVARDLAKDAAPDENLFSDTTGAEAPATASFRQSAATDPARSAARAAPAGEHAGAVDPEAEETDAAVSAKLDRVRQAVARQSEQAPKPLVLTPQDIDDAATRTRGRDAGRPQAFTPGLDDAPVESSLSPEDEADLRAELAALQAEAEAAVTSDLPPREPAPKTGRKILSSAAPQREEASLNRLLQTTNSKLGDKENVQKQSAFSHLKAAVLSRKAEPADADPLAAEPRDPDASYRDDLQALVGAPRAPEQPSAPSKADPLVLKPDAPKATPGTPVQPRRVSRTTGEGRPNPEAFAAYLTQVGAFDLQEILEAAAAYLKRSEGVASFTRPQILNMVMRQVGEKGVTREDGMRSFGNLLRTGVIQKVDRGQFSLTEDSRYLNVS